MGLINLRFKDHGAVVAQQHLLARSPYWPEVQRRFVQANPLCVACGQPHWTHSCFDHQVHHAVIPFHFAVLLGRPDLELDPANLCTFCEPPGLQHHLLLGHLGDFHSYNPDVVNFARKYKDWPAAKIRADLDWQTAATRRPKPFADLTVDEVRLLRRTLDERFPLNGQTAEHRIAELVAR